MKARLPQGMGKGPSNNMNRDAQAGSENAGRDHSSSGRP